MKILVLLTVIVATCVGTVSADSSFGFSCSAEIGTIQENLFKLYQNEELVESANLGENLYADLRATFYWWKLSLGGHYKINYYDFYSKTQNMSVGALLEFYPVDIISIGFGWDFNDKDGLSLPYQYALENNRTYMKISFKLGGTR